MVGQSLLFIYGLLLGYHRHGHEQLGRCLGIGNLWPLKVGLASSLRSVGSSSGGGPGSWVCAAQWSHYAACPVGFVQIPLAIGYYALNDGEREGLCKDEISARSVDANVIDIPCAWSPNAM